MTFSGHDEAGHRAGVRNGPRGMPTWPRADDDDLAIPPRPTSEAQRRYAVSRAAADQDALEAEILAALGSEARQRRQRTVARTLQALLLTLAAALLVAGWLLFRGTPAAALPTCNLDDAVCQQMLQQPASERTV